MLVLCVYHLPAQSVQGVKKFNLNDLVNQCREQNTNRFKFLDEESVIGDIYLLPAGQKGGTQVHAFDQVYYVISGVAELALAGGTQSTIKPGKIIFVKAGVQHHFFNVTEDLNLLVLFSKAKPDSTTKPSTSFDLLDLQKIGRPNENSWNPFVKTASMSFGLYQLPKSLGGDSTLVHPWDEINVVTKSTGKFSVDGKDIVVTEGDVIYVQKGHGHYFHDLKSDFDVLILFERKSVQK
jgi:quercetin dioxygenase-like cupin family protein